MQIKKMSHINHKPSTNASKDTLGQPHNVHPADPAVPHAKSNSMSQQPLQSKPCVKIANNVDMHAMPVAAAGRVPDQHFRIQDLCAQLGSCTAKGPAGCCQAQARLPVCFKQSARP